MKFNGESGRVWSYDPKQRLGKVGGFGSVYLGQGDDGERVAVKVIKAQTPGGGDLHERLQHREVEIISKVKDCNSSNLLCYQDVGRRGDSILVVMERAERSLSDHLPVQETEAINLLGQVASGLYDLHQLGIIHRDLKPDNVLLVGTNWKLSDFGIAHDQEVGTQTYTFQGWGTWAYMAPELFKLQSPTVKSDLYALGCLAFEIVSGNPPFIGPALEDYREQHESQAPPSLNLESHVLNDLILRLLQKDPSTRPQDARAVLERLQKIALPLTEVQQRLAQLSSENATVRAKQESVRAEERATLERRRDMRSQAMADLEILITDGLDEIRAVVHEAQVAGGGGQFVVKGPDASLTVEIWSSDDLAASEQDPIIIAGEIHATNWRLQGADRLANLVAEVRDGRIAWFIYEFMRSALVAQYSLGSHDRPHGFDQSAFRQERIYMINSGMHIWTKSVVQLDGGALAQLFVRAMELGLS